MKQSILLVEDNQHIMKINRDSLREAGYRILEAKTVREARTALDNEAPDLIILDIMLPDGDGVELCRLIRGDSNIPVLFLSAKKENAEIISGLKAGGDDYLPKPYDINVMLARVEALLRRSADISRSDSVQFGSLDVRLDRRRALFEGKDLLLTPKEFAILEMLVHNQGSYVHVETLYGVLWGIKTTENMNTVKEHVYRLRCKLSDAPVKITSSRYRGYCLTALDGSIEDQ